MIDGRLDAVFTWPLVDELIDVLRRPKLAGYAIDDRLVGAVLELAWPVLPSVEIEVEVDVELRDPADRIVVEAAVAGAVDAIVTGDTDLLADEALTTWLRDRRIVVVTPTELAAELARHAR